MSDLEVAQAAAAVPPTTSAVSDKFRNILEQAQRRAALSGAFVPDDLFVESVDKDTKDLVLSRLVPGCDVVPGSGGRRWTMLNEPRTAVLQDMLSRQELGTVLQRPLPDTDTFGGALREVLRSGGNLDLETRDLPALLDMSKAVEAIGPLPVPKPDIEQLRQKIERASFLKDFDTLIGRGVVGRDQQRTDLRAWVDLDPASRGWDGLLLTGLGGSGKSTLLVELLQKLVREGKAIVALLDFDRPGINPSDTTALEFEISRQVGYQVPAAESELRSARRELRDINQRPGQSGADFQTEHYQRTTRSLMHTMGTRLGGKGHTTFVLALDTFETVLERDQLGKLLEWLTVLFYALSIKLKVIFSGRVFEKYEKQLERFVKTTIELGELEPRDAAKMLENFGLDAALASRIAHSDVLPRRPLELRLLARLMQDRKGNLADLDELERELREGGPAAQDLFAGLVYRRVLQRIPEGPARELAYPGLVLRYLTVEILTEVLAPALGMKDFDASRAESALDELGRFDWLVYRQGDQLWHRSDLRRSTLAPMLVSDPERALKIREHAIRYFARNPPTGELLPEMEAEGFYHRLMSIKPGDHGGEFYLPTLKKLETYIEPFVAELPPTGAAIVKLARGQVLSIDSIDQLPQFFRTEAADQIGHRLMADREFGKAYALHDRTRLAHWPSRDLYNDPTLPWRRDVAFATAHWDDLIHNLPGATQDLNGLRTLGWLYPYEIAAPMEAESRQVAEWLAEDLPKLSRPERSRRPGSSVEIQRRIAIVSMLVNSRDAFNARQRRVLHEMLDHFLKGGKDMADDLSFVWLARIARARMKYRLTLRPFNLCLRRDWLEGFEQHARELDPADEVIAMVRSVGTSMLATSMNMRSLLNLIDSLDNARTRPYFKLDGDSEDEVLWWTLRGPIPELRHPLRFALLDRFQTLEDYRVLAQLLQDHIDVPLEDFENDLFATRMTANPEEELTSYIEMVDRHWRLAEFADACAREKPGERLEAVCAACHRWDDGVRAAMLGAGAAAV